MNKTEVPTGALRLMEAAIGWPLSNQEILKALETRTARAARAQAAGAGPGIS